MSVPPRSLAPACRSWRAPSMPHFTHDACTLSMEPRYAIRPTACINSTSRNVGPVRALCCKKIGVAMCTNGSGTNSVKPPVSDWSARVRNRWAATCSGRSTEPNMIVTFERRPTSCAARCASSHCCVSILSGQRIARTSSWRISAAVPGNVRSPASLSVRRYSCRSTPSRRAPSVTSSAVKPWMWICGATSVIAWTTLR